MNSGDPEEENTRKRNNANCTQAHPQKALRKQELLCHGRSLITGLKAREVITTPLRAGHCLLDK